MISSALRSSFQRPANVNAHLSAFSSTVSLDVISDADNLLIYSNFMSLLNPFNMLQ